MSICQYMYVCMVVKTISRGTKCMTTQYIFLFETICLSRIDLFSIIYSFKSITKQACYMYTIYTHTVLYNMLHKIVKPPTDKPRTAQCKYEVKGCFVCLVISLAIC